MDSRREHEIVRGLLAGSSEAWSALYEAYFEPIWQFVARLMGTQSADIGSVVQETFLAAARSAPSYEPDRAPLWLWLCGIARNQVGTYRRKQNRIGRIEQGGDLTERVGRYLAGWLDAQTTSPPDALARKDVADQVRITLAELSTEHQAILLARYCDDTSVHLLARRHGCSLVAMRSKLARARRAFRKAFESHLACSGTDGAGARS